MKQITDTLFYADEGKTFIRKEDGFDMGNGIDLGVDDTIENYEETPIQTETDQPKKKTSK